VFYDNIKLALGFRINLLEEEKVIVEIKSVERSTSVFYNQLLTYLKLTHKRLGLLINFNANNLSNSIIRIVNGL